LESIIFPRHPADSIDLSQQDAYVVAEDTGLIALVPEFIRVLGSIVIVSSSNARCVMELADPEVAALARLISAMARAIEAAFNPDGLNVWWATGELAGQLEPRALVELVPRYKDVPYQYTDLTALPRADSSARLKVVQAISQATI